jgi:hypothetical protein
MGEGVRPSPDPEPPPSPPPSPPPEEREPAPVATPPDEPPPTASVEIGAEPESHAVSPEPADAPPDAPPVADAPLQVDSPFRPRPRPASSFAADSSGLGRWLPIAFLVIIAMAALIMFRDVIVEALPGLGPVYAAMGLLAHPAIAPHG